MAIHIFIPSQRLCSTDLLDRYRKALEKAVQISCQYNVPPLPGRTVIVFSPDLDVHQTMKQDFCLPREPDKDSGEGEEGEEQDDVDEDSKRRNKKKKGLSPTVRTHLAIIKNKCPLY